MDEFERYEIQQALERKHPRTRILYDFTGVDVRTIAKWFRKNAMFEQKQSDDIAKRINNLKEKRFDNDRLCEFVNYYDKQADIGLMAQISMYKYPKNMDSERMTYTHLMNQRAFSRNFPKDKRPYEFTHKDWKNILKQTDLSEMAECFRFNKNEINLIAESFVIFIKEQDTQPQYRTPLHPLAQ